ncbi:MAG: pilus assembly protein N-terminal domain-containing protein, partial [Oceanicaulis sp.]
MMRMLGLAALALAALAPGAPAAQLAGGSMERNNTLQVVIREPGDGPVSRTLDLPLGQAAIVHLPVDTGEVMVASDTVADAVVRTPRRALLLGQAVGRTNVFFFDPDGDLILDLDVRVERDMAALNDALARFVPDSRIQAESMNANIVLSGAVPSASAADQALQVARRWVEDPSQVVSFLTVEGRDQVTLRVRIVEMERNIVRQLGVNLSGTQNFGDLSPARRIQATDDLGVPLIDEFGDPIFEVFQPGRFQNGTTFGTQNGFGVAGAALGGLAGTVSTTNFVGSV